MPKGGGTPFRVEIEGYKEFVAAARKARADLPKKLGELHKDIGSMVISKLHPRSVGQGAGAQVRPSASKREVMLRVGGGWRSEIGKARQWGKRQEWPGGGPPRRPDILGTARSQQGRIEAMLLQGIEDNFKPPFQ